MLSLLATEALPVSSADVLKRDPLGGLLGIGFFCLGLSFILPLPALRGPEDFLPATVAREVFLAAQATGWFARVVVWRI